MTESVARFAGEGAPVEQPVLGMRLTRTILLAIAVAGFFAFGVALTANSQIASGGTWTLYAMLMEQGARPYTDLHLPQQPLFFLYNRLWYALTGQNWILSQVSAAIVLAFYCNGYCRLARHVPWGSWSRAIVFLGAALSAIGWDYYSFFDYRAFTDTFAVYVTLLLFRLSEVEPEDGIVFAWPIALGCLCGLSFATRANDGLMLWIAVTAILLHWFPGQWWRNAILLLAAATGTVAIIVLLTGDGFVAYFEHTLHSAPAMKGGTGQVILSPIMLVADIGSYLAQWSSLFLSALVLAAVVVPAVLIHRAKCDGAASPKRRSLVLIGAILALEAIWILPNSGVPGLILPWLLLVLIALAVYAALGVLRVLKVTNRRAMLMLVPASALVAAGMSSGGNYFGLYGPLGLLLVLLPVVFGKAIEGRNRTILLALYVMLAATIVIGKVRVPMQWEHYRSAPMFLNRELVHRDSQGPMLVEREMNGFFSDVCNVIDAQGEGRGLLSLPYSYANYHCGIAPWRRYVQTYFDTTSGSTIDGLMRALDEQSPTWIVYQRQLDRIGATERAFNHGQPIRHRALDTYIWGHIQHGRWHVVRSWSDEPGSEWYFIRTSPPGS
ncbi:MAG: hypothetical protein EOO76_07925 [Novosphingobium sp.]|nr:MAG: hypothetical protein EOO76_07925 [Novosphingobium sp.]